MSGRRPWLASLVGGVALAITSTTAFGLPVLGQPREALTLVDAWDRALDLGRYRGMPMLLLYEDKDSATLNAPLKAQLARLAAGDRYRSSIALVAIADVTGYDYWPVRGFVKDAIQGESRKQGTDIYCDWTGSARQALQLDRGTSNVVLYDRAGRVAFSASGALSEARREELVRLLRSYVE